MLRKLQAYATDHGYLCQSKTVLALCFSFPEILVQEQTSLQRQFASDVQQSADTATNIICTNI